MLIWIAVGVITLLVLRWWVKRHPSKRKIRRVERKSTRHLRTRHIKRRGDTHLVEMCDVCGDVKTRCSHFTKKAGIAKGMGQKR